MTSDEMSDDQTVRWNGPSGRAWAEAQVVLDQMLQPFEDRLVGAIDAGSNATVLDIGCGTGATTLAIARRLGVHGRSVGVDVSAPMIEVARARAARDGVPASFVLGDAATHAFEPASVDAFVSRFGVMFFADPVKAFAHLRRAARSAATLQFVAWRSPADNPFMTTAERAAAPLLPELPARRPGAPGQFAFADRDRVRDILEASGWRAIDVRPIDEVCELPEPELDRYLTRIGPVGNALQHTDEALRARIAETVRRAFDVYVDGDLVRFTAACWMVTARAAA